MQPKFKGRVFDSTKDPTYFRTWLRLISGIVHTIQGFSGGALLGKFLDKCFLTCWLREKYASVTRLAFLDDPRLDFFGRSDGHSEHSDNGPQARGSPESDSGPHGASVMNCASYSDVDEDSAKSDKHLIHLPFTIAKGGMLSPVADLTGDHARCNYKHRHCYSDHSKRQNKLRTKSFVLVTSIVHIG